VAARRLERVEAGQRDLVVGAGLVLGVDADREQGGGCAGDLDAAVVALPDQHRRALAAGALGAVDGDRAHPDVRPRPGARRAAANRSSKHLPDSIQRLLLA
jgi:hypothetical protein